MSSIGIIIGRFQTAGIQDKLRRVIDGIAAEHDSLAIIIGGHKTGATRRNPLEVDLRKAMISKAFPEAELLSIEDHPSDTEWSSQLDALVETTFRGKDVCLHGSRDGFVQRYSGKFRANAIGESYTPENIVPIPDSADFREGMIHALKKTFAKVYPTVDIAVFKDDRSEVLLGMKSTGKKWRFPGGFTDPDDRSYEDAAVRELNEECGISDITKLTYEASFPVDDWRYRFEDDKIITILFSADLRSGNASAGDDLKEVKWFPLAHVESLVNNGETVSEHLPLFRHLLGKYHH